VSWLLPAPIATQQATITRDGSAANKNACSNETAEVIAIKHILNFHSRETNIKAITQK